MPLALWTPNNTLPREDYLILQQEVDRLCAKSVLEFGPGFSTYAFIEAGVPKIVSLENIEKWRNEYAEQFKGYPQVKVRAYENTPEATSDVPPGEQFDLCFVDSPKGYNPERVIHPGQEDCSRLNTVQLGLKHSKTVLLHDATRPLERATLSRAHKLGYKVTFIENSKYGLARIEHNGA